MRLTRLKELLTELVPRAPRLGHRFLFEPIDARIYAAVRISYGIASLAIVAELWPMRKILFCSDGAIVRAGNLPWYLPLRWVDSEAGVSALMIAMGFCALFTTIGLFARLSTLALYLWAFSYAAVASPAETGYDALARLIGLALVVSPSARRWALDGRVFGPGPAQVPRYGLRLIQWQLAIVYAVTVWLKLPDPYWRNGEFMSYFMMSIFSRVPSPVWAEWGRASALSSWASLLFETTIPVLLFTTRGRRLGIWCGILLHGGIAVASTIGMFSLCMIPLYAAFLRAEDFDAVVPTRTRSDGSRARYLLERGRSERNERSPPVGGGH
jgi:hypothetical protein